PGNDGDVVARPHPPILAKVAVEVAHLVARIEVHGTHVGADLVFAVEVAHGEVLRVHVVTHGDVASREADHLSVAAYLFPRASRVPRHLVAGPDVLPHLDTAAGVLEHAARSDLLLGDGD